MRIKFHLLFAFFTLLFLFYPGDNIYFKILVYSPKLFNKQEKKINLNINPIPFLKANYPPEISAEGAYILDLQSFTPIFEKNINQRFLPASTTKIITALVAYDIYKPDQIITVKKTINEGQLMGLVPSEKIIAENLLYGILVHSGNDAAYVLADNYGFKKFITLMNKKATDLHMNTSHFNNPAGLDDFTQYTTPYDLALASRALLQNHYLAKIVSTKEITISDINYKYFHRLTNVNKLLGEIQGIGGLKTGYTENAGENLISFYKNNGRDYLIIILKSQDRFLDTKNIVKWLQENIDYYSID